MMDCGIFLSWNVERGQYSLLTIREAVLSNTQILPTTLLTRNPEINVVIGESPQTDISFTYLERANRFTKETVSIEDDGEALLFRVKKAKEVAIYSFTDFDTVAQVVHRRSQEELANNRAFTLSLNKEARLLYPGQNIIIYGEDELNINSILVVFSVTLDPNSGDINLEVVNNFYNTEIVSFLPSDIGINIPSENLPPDDTWVSLYELPAWFGTDKISCLWAAINLDEETFTKRNLFISRNADVGRDYVRSARSTAFEGLRGFLFDTNNGVSDLETGSQSFVFIEELICGVDGDTSYFDLLQSGTPDTKALWRTGNNKLYWYDLSDETKPTEIMFFESVTVGTPGQLSRIYSSNFS